MTSTSACPGPTPRGCGATSPDNAPGLREVDQADACLPLLPDAARTWLRSALQLAHPDHPWIVVLG